jgi:N-acetylmuramoyl-L-alanine amidase
VTQVWRGRWRRTAVAMLLAVALPAFGWDVCAAAAQRPPATSSAPAAPVLQPVSLHAWAKTIGAEVAWLEKNKKLRVKNAFHTVDFEIGRREVLVDGLRVFLGDAPLGGKRTLTISPVDRDRLLLPLLAPHQLSGLGPVRTIVLDAGHGGKDKGAANDPLKLLEKNVALDVAKRLKPLLEARGYTIILTRENDTFIELGERPRRAAKVGADLFLAIHFNAGPPTVTGIETYTVPPQYQRSTASERIAVEDLTAAPGNTWDVWNALLGFSIQRQMIDRLGRFDRGLKRARFVVIRDLATCPGVLIECGYLSNTAEAKLIATPAHRERIAVAIAAGVDAFVAHLGAANPPASAPSPTTTNGGGAIRAPRPPSTP